MTLVAGTGAVGKIKSIVCELSGFTGTGTSDFGSGSDINCESVEYLSIGRPDTDENETEEFETNMRKVKDNIATKGWADWDKMSVFNDEAGQNWKAFIAAKETDATGTMTLKKGSAGPVIGSWKCKVSNVSGGDGEAGSLDTAFTPTFTLLESLKAQA